MMNGIFLLDTNAVIARLSNDQSIIRRIQSAEVVVSAIVLGELYFGAEKSARMQSNVAEIERFAQRIRVVSCDNETAKFYGRIRNGLRQKGRPIPENDIWIAATVLQYDLTLLTRDAHFQNVDDLRIQSW